MEKRAILAAVLSLLVLWIYQYFFAPRPPLPTPASQQTAPPTAAEPTDRPPAGGSILSRGGDRHPEEGGGAREVVVETSLYRAIFTTSGGRLKSFKLKDYGITPEEGSERVDLVRSVEEGFLPAEVWVGGLEEAPFGLYRPSQDRLEVSEGEGEVLSFYWSGPQGEVEKRWVFHDGDYEIDLTVEAKANERSLPGDVSFRWYGGSHKGSRYGFTGAAVRLGDQVLRERAVKLKEPKEFTGDIGWVAYLNRYFLFAIVPMDAGRSAVRLSKEYFNTATKQTIIGVTSSTFGPAVGPHRSIVRQWKLFIGPKGLRQLRAFGFHLEAAINFGWFGFLAKPLALFMVWTHNHFIPNYGLVIILLTLLIKILFIPLTHKSQESMKRLQILKPEMDRIKERFGKDRERMNREMMDLYRRHKVNPLGGCLPMLLQIPVFFALYKVLLESIELRHAPFFAWINDLSSPEDLGSLSIAGFTLPIRILPLVMGFTMWLQQKFSPTSLDPRQAQMMIFMPILFTILFWGFPSGLVIYWLTNNLLSIAQQVATHRLLK